MAEPEAWLRGPVPGIDAWLQPVAHALIQCREEVRGCIGELPAEALALRPGGVASADYHVRHAMGSLDRLLTYARGKPLGEDQRAALAAESTPSGRSGAELAREFELAVEMALEQLRATPPATLLEPRAVGRARLPSNVLGLLFHAAEHTQRHTGQLTTTARFVRGGGGED